MQRSWRHQRKEKRGPLREGTPATNEQISGLKEQVLNMQLEIDILKATLDVLKKDPGVDRSALKNREKATMIDALKNKYPLPTLLQALCYARSSYFYGKKAKSKVTCIRRKKCKSEQSLKTITRVMDIVEFICL